MTRIRVATLTGNAAEEAALAALLARCADFELVMRCVDRLELLAVIKGARLDAIIAAGAPYWLDKHSAVEAKKANVPLIGLSDDPGAVARLKTLGASVLPTRTDVEELAAACLSASPGGLRVADSDGESNSQVVAIWGPKGSPGRTRVAIELATQLARIEPRTLLVDADSYGGDLLQLLGIAEEVPNLLWATRMAAKEELDLDSLALSLRRAGEQGPVLLPGLSRPELWAEVSDFGWRELLALTRSTFRYVLCDVGFCLEPGPGLLGEASEGRNRIARVAVREADRVIAVFRADATGIKHFLWSFDQLRDLVELDRILVVANGGRAADEDDVRKLVRTHTGKRLVAYLPLLRKELVRVETMGSTLLASRRTSPFGSELALVSTALGTTVPSSGFLARLGGRA